MKKIIALLLALIMAFGCASVAFAEEEEITCKFCGQHFSDKDIRNEHEETCKKNPNIMEINNYACSFCGQHFNEKQDRNKHEEDCKKSPQNALIEYACSFCGRHFSDFEERNEHENICVNNPNEIDSNTNYIECPYCYNKIAEASYNAHIEICYGQTNNHTVIGDVTIANLFERFITVFDYNASWLDGIEGVVIRIMDLFEHIALYLVEKVDLSQIKTK